MDNMRKVKSIELTQWGLGCRITCEDGSIVVIKQKGASQRVADIIHGWTRGELTWKEYVLALAAIAPLRTGQNYPLEEKVFTRRLFGYKCAKCHKELRVDKGHIDHHKPYSRGFGISRANAVLLCRNCNSKKSAKMPEDFYNKSELRRIEALLKTAGNSEKVYA